MPLRGDLDDLRQTNVAFRSGHQPKPPRFGAECHRMDLQICIKQAVDQEIGAEMNAIAAIGLEQDGARHQSVLHEDAGVEPKIGADVDEKIRLDRGGAADEIFQLLQPADIDRAHQKLGAEITANEIAAAMDEFIVGAVEATPDFIAPA